MTKLATPTAQPATNLLCEFACQPFDDCYCRDVTGRTVANIAMYCMDRYRECPIYCKWSRQEGACGGGNKNSPLASE